MRNLHPADQLAEVRKDLEDLKAKEKFLRTLLLETGDFRGEEWRAHPQERSQQRLDSVAAKQRYGELLEPFQVTQTYTILRLVRVIGSQKNGFPHLPGPASTVASGLDRTGAMPWMQHG